MTYKSHYNPVFTSSIAIARGIPQNIRFVLQDKRFVLRNDNISFCGLYHTLKIVLIECYALGRIIESREMESQGVLIT